jgi:hypothetical protein
VVGDPGTFQFTSCPSLQQHNHHIDSYQLEKEERLAWRGLGSYINSDPLHAMAWCYVPFPSMAGESEIIVAQVREIILIAFLAWCSITTNKHIENVRACRLVTCRSFTTQKSDDIHVELLIFGRPIQFEVPVKIYIIKKKVVPDASHCKVDDPFQFPVEKEVVERPSKPIGYDNISKTMVSTLHPLTSCINLAITITARVNIWQ